MVCSTSPTNPAWESFREFTRERKVKGLVSTIVFSPPTRRGGLALSPSAATVNFAKA